MISNSSSQQDDLLCSSWLWRSSRHPTSPPLPHQPSPPYTPRGACFLASHFHARRLQQQRPHHPLHTGWAVPGCPPPFTNHLANSSPRQEGQQQRHLYLGHRWVSIPINLSLSRKTREVGQCKVEVSLEAKAGLSLPLAGISCTALLFLALLMASNILPTNGPTSQGKKRQQTQRGSEERWWGPISSF